VSARELLCFSEVWKRPVGRRSIGGGELHEGRLAKFIYMDEAGTDIGAPVTVVAGVVVDPDKEWDRVFQLMEGLRRKLPDIPENWVLHATELFSGGRTLTRDKYGKEIRHPVLEGVFQLPRMMKLPIFVAYQWEHPAEEGWDPKNEMFFRHCTTFIGALKSANGLMREAYPDERANITAEDVPDKRQFLGQIPIMLRMASTPEYVTGPTPFDRIVDTPNFASKQGAPHLVLADGIAFAVRLYLSGHKDGHWAMQHLFGTDDYECIFEEGRKHTGGSYALDWRRLG
jgi:hypothetical protein